MKSRRLAWADMLLILAGSFCAIAVVHRVSSDNYGTPRRVGVISVPEPGVQVNRNVPELSEFVVDSVAQTFVFFTAECPWSMASVKQWNDLLDIIHGAGERAVAISLSDSVATAAFVQARGFRWPVVVAGHEDRWPVDQFRVGTVPLTLRVDRSSVVTHVWRGWFERVAYDKALAAITSKGGAP